MKEETYEPRQLAAVSPLRQRQSLIKSSVFERLYRQSKRHLESKSPPSRSKSVSKLNFGQLLYYRGLKDREKQREILKQKEAEQVTKENCPFKPKINELSSMLSPRYFEKTEDILLRKSETYKMHLNTLKEERLKEEMKECSFSPRILKSRSPMRSTQPKTELLYQDSQKRQERRLLISQTVFKLNNPSSPPQSNGRRRSPTSQEAWADKMINQKKDFETRMKLAREEMNAREINQNGTAFYRPNIGRSPRPRKEGKTIHEYLYSKRNDRQSKKVLVENQQHSEWNKLASSIKVNAYSFKLFEKFRGKVYARVFSLLDTDDDGEISASRISIDTLDDAILEVITPILKLLDQGEEMNLKQFVGYMEQLWNKLSPTQKSVLMKSENKQSPSPTRRVLISPKSRKYAQQKYSMASTDMYERMMHWSELNEMKNAKKKELNVHAELRQCTFSPTIKKYTRKR